MSDASGGYRPARLQRLALGIVFAVALMAGLHFPPVLGQQEAQASHCGTSSQRSAFSAQQTTEAAYGVDGYLQYAPGSLTDPACNKIVMGFFVNTSDKQSFVQVGSRIGFLSTGGSYDSAYQVFVERVDACLDYSRVTFGAPPSVNSAYYLYYTGSSTNIFCVPFYTFAVKIGSFGSAPLTYGLLRVASPPWTAQTELGSLKTSPPWSWLGTTYHGNPSTNPGFGMAWYNYGDQTWYEWDTAIATQKFTQVTTGFSQPLTYCPDVSYRAFHTVKGGSC